MVIRVDLNVKLRGATTEQTAALRAALERAALRYVFDTAASLDLEPHQVFVEGAVAMEPINTAALETT